MASKRCAPRRSRTSAASPMSPSTKTGRRPASSAMRSSATGSLLLRSSRITAFMSCLQQFDDGVRADVTGTAGHENGLGHGIAGCGWKSGRSTPGSRLHHAAPGCRTARVRRWQRASHRPEVSAGRRPPATDHVLTDAVKGRAASRPEAPGEATGRSARATVIILKCACHTLLTSQSLRTPMSVQTSCPPASSSSKTSQPSATF